MILQVDDITGQSGLQQSFQRIFQKSDTDQSKALSSSEFSILTEKIAAFTGQAVPAGTAESVFNQFDTDGDGELTWNEMKGFEESRVKQYAEVPKPELLDPATVMRMLQHAFEDADKDDSDGLNLDEFTGLRDERAERTNRLAPENTEQLFSRIDSNGDGELTQDELRAHHEERRQNKLAKLSGGVLSPDILRALLNTDEV